MRPTRKSLAAVAIAGVAATLAVSLYGCETKVTELSVACRPINQPNVPIQWFYTSKVDRTLLSQIVPTIDVTLKYTGGSARKVPPITTYFYRRNGATLRITSHSTARLRPKGTFTYHIDAGGYIHALDTSGRGEPELLTLFVEVDGNHFSGPLSPAACRHWPDNHLDLSQATEVPDLNDKHPLNMGSEEWAGILALPAVVIRKEGTEVSNYAFFPAPITLTEVKNEAGVPDDLAKQNAQVGVTAATPTYTLSAEPAPTRGETPAAGKGG
jgi:hypothetical protein